VTKFEELQLALLAAILEDVATLEGGVPSAEDSRLLRDVSKTVETSHRERLLQDANN
jgi:hypothetical protein